MVGVRWRRLLSFGDFSPGNRVLALPLSLGAVHRVHCRTISKHLQALSSVPSPDTFPPFKVADYKKIFDKFDVDSGGTIDAQELGTLIRGLGWVNPMLFILS